jgi:uncharacterized membrane protein HdeD (DUF308 family)
MNFNNSKKPTQEPKKNNTKTIIGIVIMAILIIFVVIGAMYLANGMNNVVSSFSSVEEPTSVLQGLMSKP